MKEIKSKKVSTLLFNVTPWIAGSLICFFAACMKEDEPVVLPPHAGDAQVASVNIGEDYRRQVFFDLETKDTLGNDYEAWDLAFESGSSGFHVWINGGKGVLSSQTNQTNILNVNDTALEHWKYDASSWNVDSTAIGNWQSSPAGTVYIIDRGSTATERFWKIIFQIVTPGSYEVAFCKLNESTAKTMTIYKLQTNNYSYFSFDNNGTVVNIEPEKSKWDILFTRYRYIYYQFNPPLPYIVNGVLLNPELTFAAVDSIKSYNDIDYNYAKTLTLSANRDAIGFDWKYIVSISNPHYNVRSNYIYIIKDQEGYYYKLHFLDFYGFYNSQEHKGVPKFEYQRL